MDAIKNTANQISENLQGAGSGASKEANKHIAKDGNVDTSTRLTAAKDAVGDKFDQKKHETNADVAKEKNNLL